MEVKLQLAKQQTKEEQTNLYAIVTGAPNKGNKEVKLYLAPANLSDVIAYGEGLDLDGAVEELFDHSINVRLDGGDSTRPDFLGWPAIFTSLDFVQAGGDGFWGYEPFIANRVPTEALLKFAQLYTDRVLKAKEQEKHP